jgi:hypothetical protein
MDNLIPERIDHGQVRTITIPASPRPATSLAHYTAVISDQIQARTPWQKITGQYDVNHMGGPEIIMFANDLMAAGVDQSEALAVTWPISSRNLLEKIGRPDSAPTVECWEDVLGYHITQREIARSRNNYSRVVWLDKLIRLARNLQGSPSPV